MVHPLSLKCTTRSINTGSNPTKIEKWESRRDIQVRHSFQSGVRIGSVKAESQS